MKHSILTASAIILISLSNICFADNTRDPGVNARQHKQQDRIENGLRSGELTVRETRKLAKQQRRINKMERKYKSDGHLSKKERVRLHAAQNRASANIYKKKHNGRKR